MKFQQCAAIVFLERNEAGGRGRMGPPRRCRKVALDGAKYCELHAGQADIQELYEELLGFGWEAKVEWWQNKRRG